MNRISTSAQLDRPIVSEPTAPAHEVDRWSHTRLRRRILYGQWREDLRSRVIQELRSEERADAWGEPDLSADIFSPACEALSALYAPDRPRVSYTGSDSIGADEVLRAVTAGGLWDLMVRVQRDTIGLREMVVRVEPTADGLTFSPIFPDRCTARPGIERDVPAMIAHAEYEQRDGDARPCWYWHEWSIEDLDDPYLQVYRDGQQSVVVYERRGADYPYRDAEDRPVLPFALYHAERTGYLWDPYQNARLVESALRLGVLWTFYGHLVRNASWPQRYILGAFMPTESSETSDATGRLTRPPRLRTVTDPATVLTLTPDLESSTQPVVGTFPPGSDPLVLAQSIEVYERRAIGLAGLDSATVSRKDGDPRSGYALAVSQDARAELRMRYAPAFSRGDLQLLSVAAAVLGSVRGSAYPATGYAIEYGPDTTGADTVSTALTGGQVSSLVQVVMSVASGAVPRDAGVQIVSRALGVTVEDADGILGTAGTASFVPSAAPTTLSTAAPSPEVSDG